MAIKAALDTLAGPKRARDESPLDPDGHEPAPKRRAATEVPSPPPQADRRIKDRKCPACKEDRDKIFFVGNREPKGCSACLQCRQTRNLKERYKNSGGGFGGDLNQALSEWVTDMRKDWKVNAQRLNLDPSANDLQTGLWEGPDALTEHAELMSTAAMHFSTVAKVKARESIIAGEVDQEAESDCRGQSVCDSELSHARATTEPDLNRPNASPAAEDGLESPSAVSVAKTEFCELLQDYERLLQFFRDARATLDAGDMAKLHHSLEREISFAGLRDITKACEKQQGLMKVEREARKAVDKYKEAARKAAEGLRHIQGKTSDFAP